MSTYPYFVQNFVLPALAALLVGLILAAVGGGRHWSWKKRFAITLPVAIVAFLVCWSVTRNDNPDGHLSVVAGTVVDQSSNDPVGQAVVSLADGSLRELSDDSGNFRLDLTGTLKGARVRIHVAKDGYAPADRTAEVPAEGLTIQLHHL